MEEITTGLPYGTNLNLPNLQAQGQCLKQEPFCYKQEKTLFIRIILMSLLDTAHV
jgi:hypothetical protein